MTREERIAFSDGLPSRLKYPPGILPEAYIFSSKSTERGRKSMPSRGSFDAVALQRTTVSPYLTRQDPLASPHIIPVSTVSGLPAKVYLNSRCLSKTMGLLVTSYIAVPP